MIATVLAERAHVRRDEPALSAGRQVRMMWRSLVMAAAVALGVVADRAISQGATGGDPVLLSKLKTEGAGVYDKNCARCHGTQGEGQRHSHDAAPRLKGRFADLSVERIAVLVSRGGSYMPRFDGLTDREIAAVATFVRNSFGNDRGIVTEQDISLYR